MELVGVFNRIQDHFSEIGLDILESTDILPSSVRDLYDGLTEGRGIALSGGELEVLIGDTHSIENLGINVIIINIDQVHLFTNALEGGLLA